jgi:hypothetical protein
VLNKSNIKTIFKHFFSLFLFLFYLLVFKLKKYLLIIFKYIIRFFVKIKVILLLLRTVRLMLFSFIISVYYAFLFSGCLVQWNYFHLSFFWDTFSLWFILFVLLFNEINVFVYPNDSFFSFFLSLVSTILLYSTIKHLFYLNSFNNLFFLLI